MNSIPTTCGSIQEVLIEVHGSFSERLMGMSQEDFEFSPDAASWNAGQHLAHIQMSLTPLRKVMRLPKWFIRWKWGTANRPSRSYEGVRERYLEKLQQLPKVFTNPFSPHRVMVGERAGYCASMTGMVKKIDRSLQRYSEEELDRLILPHPLLGKVTLREMMFNIIYHVLHHQRLIADQLADSMS